MERMHHYWGFMSKPPASLERMHHYWSFMSIHSSKYGKDASLLGLHIHTLQYVWKECITTGTSCPYIPVSMERMHHYWGFMSIYPSKYGKDASLLGLHVHTLQLVWKGCITTGASCPYTPVSLERMHHYRGFMSIHSSKYGKDASLLGLHVHTSQ